MFSRYFLVVFYVSILLGASFAASQNMIKDDFRVNSNGSGFEHRLPDIDMDTTGNCCIVWEILRDTDYDIYAQRFDCEGEFSGESFLVNDQSLKNQKNPSIAKIPSGEFLIVWQDLKNGNYDIYAQLFEFSGDTIGINFIINDDPGTSSQQEPDCDFGSVFVVCWMDKRGGSEDIFMQLFDSLGNKVNSNLKVNDDSDSVQIRPKVATNLSGNFVVVWQDKREGDYDIYAQRFDSLGNSLGSNFKINDDFSSSYQGFPKVDMDSSGNFVVVWQDQREGYYDVYAQFYNRLGQGMSSNFVVNDDTGSSYQGHPDVAMSSEGNFIVVWEDKRNGDSDIYAQRYDSNAHAQGGNYRVNGDFGSFEQTEPSAATDGQRICFVWQDNRLGGTDIFAKVVEWGWTDIREQVEMENPQKNIMLFQNYPNPFNPFTTISFTVHGERKSENGSIPITQKSVYGSQFMVHSPIHTTLTIYNVLGQRVRTLVNEEKTPGYHQVIWDGKDDKGKEVASGIYFYKLKTKEYTKIKRMLLLR